MKRFCHRLGVSCGSVGGLCAIALLLVLDLAVFQFHIARLRDNEERFVEIHAQLSILQELRAVIRDAESAERGFLLIGAPEYLKSYETAAARIVGAVQRLKRRAGDDPRQREQLAAMQEKVDARLAEFRTAIAARDAGGFEAAQQFLMTDHERFLMDGIRGLITEMRLDKESILAERAIESRRSLKLAATTDMMGTAIGIGLVGLAFALFRRDFLHQRWADEASRRLAAIVESSDDAIIGKSVDGVITSWNAGAREIFGFCSEEMVGRPMAKLVPPDLLAEDRENHRLAAQGIHVEQYETKRLTKHGRMIDVSLSASPVKEPSGRVIGIASIVRDITEQKTLQRAVLEIAAQEQRRIGQDLHDGTGQELTGLAMLSQRLLAMLEGKSEPEARMAAKIAEGLDDVLRGVRILSRGLVPVQLDREGLMAALADLAARTSELHDVICTFQCDEPVCIPNNNIATNLYRMSQEAVTNAIKHGDAKNITISLSIDGEVVTLRVADDGTGMKQFQASATVGVGLRIMRYRAQLIGAKLDVAPSYFHGTEVSCRFVCKRTPDGSCEPAADDDVEEPEFPEVRRRSLVLLQRGV